MTTLQDLDFPLDYFCDEVRDGFFVSESMKRFWAAQLVVLSEIDKICEKHNIKWYAEAGTLLGAIRHKGFIPWDDDIDIAMFRDDYYRFLTYAREELPDGFRILSSSDEKFDNAFGRIVNSSYMSYSSERLGKFYGCPYVVGVDIYQYDRIYENIQEEEKRMMRASLVLYTFAGIRDKSIDDKEIEKRVEQIQQENDIVIDKKNTLKDLILLFERIAQEANRESSKEIAIMDTWVVFADCLYKRSWFDNWESVKFETTTVRAPRQYHDVLQACYGDYLKPVRGNATHGFPLYRAQEKLYRDNTCTDPTRFFFKKDEFDFKRTRMTFLREHKEMINSICSVHNTINKKISEQGTDEIIPLLEACQKAAMVMGNAVEGKYGDGTQAVRTLEQYCEVVYEVSVNWDTDSKNRLDDMLIDYEKQIEKLSMSSKKDVVFLLCKASWWDSIKEVYDRAIADENNSVRIIVVPYSYLGYTKNVVGLQSDIDEFEKKPELSGRIVRQEDYMLGRKRPDVIVIQFPYDGHSGILAIPKQFYSDRLKEYTDKLVFVPYLEPDPPESKEDISYAAIRELVEQPAVVNADKVLIGSPRLRDYYVEMLTDMTDENYREFWDERMGLKREPI
ncbi:MAG: LicD family protein [Lachnospiraceae bacterium]|nr:LicD family protein [Lachnospiraceae bacterium]